METSPTQSGVVLTFKNGRKVRTVLSAPFRPEENAVQVFLPSAGNRSIPFDELCCITTAGGSSHDTDSLSAGLLEDVKLITGERFFVRIGPGQVFSNGFFGISKQGGAPLEKIFVVSSAVETRKTVQHEPVSPGIGGVDQGERSYMHGKRVGDILVHEGYLSRDQVEEALKTGERNRVGALLIKRGLISESQLLSALAGKFGCRYLDLSDVTPAREALSALTKNAVTQMQVFPIDLQGKKLVVATSDPTDLTISDNLRFITKYQIELVVAGPGQIAKSIDRFYNNSNNELDSFISELAVEQPTVLEQQDEDDVLVEPDSKVIMLVNRILIDAYLKNVSDVHLEPKLFNGPLLVRYRIDGECVISHQIPGIHKNQIMSRLKVMAKLDISERRKPQSGKIYLQYQKKRLEYRVELTPTVGEQEDAVLRLLTSAKPLSLNEMGLSAANLVKFQELLNKPYGMILCVGPTGSGKTTTLHSALAAINIPGRKIWTVEDPVEILQDGLRQVQINTKFGYTFETALRSFLRADPDVIMIGEMRDVETTRTAIAASLTGHLVFSTLHTNSAPETIGRFLELGLDPFHFADALLGIIAQRLARKLCVNCRQEYHPSLEEYEELVAQYGRRYFQHHNLPEFSPSLRLMRKRGCDLCLGTGYRGRIALHELLIGSPTVSKAIKKNLPVEELRELALQEGMRTLKMDGIQKVFEGVTDLQQVLKVCIL